MSSEPELAALGHEVPVYFLTMGSPLRQLYGLRLPNLYDWARHDETSNSEWKQQNIPADQKPNPGELTVKKWFNAFRAGDYVGRHLWRSDVCQYNFDYPAELPANGPWPVGTALSSLEPVSADLDNTRIEFCIGPGAHLKYWDDDGGTIAALTDYLIQQA